jgi:gluconate 2-dehydrogenase gamma chain
MKIDRREAIKRSAMIMGGLIFAPNALGVLSGCKARPGVDWDPRYFNRERARLISALAETIIPETDTPGAVQAGVPSFIEEMVYTGYPEAAREQFLSGMDAFNDLARTTHGSRYPDLDEDLQFRFASEQNRLAIESELPMPAFFLIMKELTVMGYFTSEIGAKLALRYEKIPGRYEGCVPFEEIGKTWAT